MILGSDRKKKQRKKAMPEKNQGFRYWEGGRWK